MVRGFALWLLLAPMAVNAEALTSERRQQLGTLLKQDCSSCHGLLFKGGLGPALRPEALQNTPDDALIDAILNGRPGTTMPPWRELLSPVEAAWLVTQLRNLP